MTRSTCLVAACALCSVVVAGVACGGGGGPATKHVTRGELAALVLPRSALGALAARLMVKRPAGSLTNAESAAGGLDPSVTTASLSKDGRLSGYTLGYSLSRAQIEDNIGVGGSGSLSIITEVDLYRTKAGPVSQMRKSISDLRALTGKPLRGGARLERGATFRLQRIADGADGFRFVIGIAGYHIYYTEVGFRFGRLLARVTEARADSKNVDASLVSLAHALDDRIKGVLSGEIPAKRVSPG